MFSPAIFYISIFPFILYPLALGDSLPNNTETFRQGLLFLSNAHVAVTLVFYYDRDFKKIILANKYRYYYAPIGTIFLSGLSFALTPDKYSFFWWSAYIFWQNWHFGKQNYGIYCMVALDGNKNSPVSVSEKALIYASTFVGSIAGMGLVTNPGIFNDLCSWVMGFSGKAYLLVVVAGLIQAIAKLSKHDMDRSLFFLFTVLFFCPIFLFDGTNNLRGVMTSTSHSFQYLFFMMVVAFNNVNLSSKDASQEGVSKALVASALFFGTIVVGGAVTTVRGDFGDLVQGWTSSAFLGKFVTGAMFGVVITHFIVDAHAWRLRDKPQREYVFNLFRFVKKTRF